MSKLIPFMPRNRKAILGNSVNGYIGVEPYYADYLQTSVENLTDEELEEIIIKMNDAGFLEEKPERVAVFDEDMFAVLELAYNGDAPSKYLLSNPARIYTIDQALSIVGNFGDFTSNKVISLAPNVESLGGNSTYYPRIRSESEPYEELQNFAGKEYDGSLDIEELKPFEGMIFGKKNLYSDDLFTRIYDYHCNGKKCDDNLYHDAGHRFAHDELFSYNIVSIGHKLFENIESENGSVNKNSFIQKLDVKLNYGFVRSM